MTWRHTKKAFLRASITQTLSMLGELSRTNPLRNYFDFEAAKFDGVDCVFCSVRHTGWKDFPHAPHCLWQRAHNITGG